MSRDPPDGLPSPAERTETEKLRGESLGECLVDVAK
jgi:hypothetical protein